MGVFTSIFFGILGSEFTTGLLLATFYLFIQFLPYAPWVEIIGESVFVKYVVINVLGFFFNPLIYYFVTLFGVPLGLPLIITVPIIVFTSGLIFFNKTQK
jgi:hypothetical protein